MGAARRIQVKRAVLEEWIELDKVECRDGLLLIDDVEHIIDERSKYISLESFLKGIEHKRFDGRYSQDRNKYIDFLEEHDFLGTSVIYPDEMEYPSEPKASYYFRIEDVNKLKKKSEYFFRFYGMSEEEKCRKLIESCQYDKTKELLSEYANTIASYTPLVTEFLEEAIRIDMKHFTNEMLISSIDSLKYVGSKDLFIEFIDYAKERVGLSLGTVNRKENHTSKDIGAYPYKIFLTIAKSIFNEETLKANCVLSKCLENTLYFESWLFISVHFVCGWRAQDICSNWPYLGENEIQKLEIDLATIKENILNNAIDESKYFEVGKYIEKSIELASVKAHKTGKASDLLAPIGKELKVFFGRMALISYYHELVNNEGKLKSARMSTYLNHVRIKDIFGEDIYRQLGRVNISSRRLNKSYLQSMEERARRDGAGTMAAYTIASFARNHADIDTTATYLYDHGLSGETAEVVLAMMMDRGVFGSIRYKEFLAAFPETFNKLSASEQTRLLAECEASAYEMEIMAADYIAEDKLKKSFAEGDKHKALEILAAMFEISQGFGKAKDNGVFCKKRALGNACENPVYESCIASVCPYLIFTETGIKSLIEVIYTYSRKAEETGHPKYYKVLQDVILPAYKEILKEFANKMKPEEAEALKTAIGEYNGKYTKSN